MISPARLFALAFGVLALSACGGESPTAPGPTEPALGTPAEAPAPAGQERADPTLIPDDELMEVRWRDLMPEGEEARLAMMRADRMREIFETPGFSSPILGHNPDDEPLSLLEAQVGTFDVIEGFDGQRVRLPGFIVPLDFRGGEFTRFLLVPYYGACIHTPPPPPNQTIYVESAEPVRIPSLSTPVVLDGVLSTGAFYSDMGATAYSMTLQSLTEYQGGNPRR